MTSVQVADLGEGGVEGRPEPARLAAAAEAVLQAEGRGGTQLSVTVVGDARIAGLHERYLGVSGPTDVIAFPLEDDLPGEQTLGEVVVSVETAAREASQRGISLEEELLRYVIHGTLHLLGYDDHEPAERERMHARQESLLAGFLSKA